MQVPFRSTRRHPFAVTLLLVLAAPGAASAQPSPAGASPPRVELKVQEIRRSLAVVSGAGGNVAVWHGSDGSVLVDSGFQSSSSQLLETVARIAPGPVRILINTHWHPDHVGGNAALARTGTVIVAHENVRERMTVAQELVEYDMKVPAAPAAALPLVSFADTLALHLQGDRVQVIHVPGAHTDGDAVVWWEAANVVHLGDVYYRAGYPFIDVERGGSLAGAVAAIEGVLSRADAATVVIPGHGALSDREELADYRDMLVAVGRKVRELVEDGKTLEEIVAARPTAEFDARYGKGGTSAERFVEQLHRDLAGRRRR